MIKIVWFTLFLISNNFVKAELSLNPKQYTLKEFNHEANLYLLPLIIGRLKENLQKLKPEQHINYLMNYYSENNKKILRKFFEKHPLISFDKIKLKNNEVYFSPHLKIKVISLFENIYMINNKIFKIKKQDQVKDLILYLEKVSLLKTTSNLLEKVSESIIPNAYALAPVLYFIGIVGATFLTFINSKENHQKDIIKFIKTYKEPMMLALEQCKSDTKNSLQENLIINNFSKTAKFISFYLKALKKRFVSHGLYLIRCAELNKLNFAPSIWRENQNKYNSSYKKFCRLSKNINNCLQNYVTNDDSSLVNDRKVFNNDRRKYGDAKSPYIDLFKLIHENSTIYNSSGSNIR